MLLRGSQGFGLRGQTDESSNFQKIINLIAKHNRNMKVWLNCVITYKWLSHNIMNEFLRMDSHAVLQNIVKEV